MLALSLNVEFHTVRPTSTAKKIGMMGLDLANLETDEHHFISCGISIADTGLF